MTFPPVRSRTDAIRGVLRIGAACCAVLAVSAAASFGGIAGSPHDVTESTPGTQVCERCHLPQEAEKTFIWAAVKNPGGKPRWPTLVVSPLCGSCHYGTPYSAGILAHDMTAYAYSDNAHGFRTAALDDLAGTDNAAASGLPYADQASIQCSSCHSPHENAVRPFMRAGSGTVQTLCALCHASRNNVGGSGTTNGTAGQNDSMHPNNVPYPEPSTARYDPGLIAASSANWQELFANGRGTAGAGSISVTAALGGKLLAADGAGGNYGCPTCHAVHGSNAGTTTGQFDHLLAANNNVSAQNGNRLCEGCHTGGAGGGLVLVGGGKDHPIDNNVSGRGAGGFDFTPWATTVAYESVYTLWPKNNGANQPACTSCHSAHYGVGQTPMQRSGGDAGDWCNSCHSGASTAPPGHHSTRDILPISLIACGDCHRTSAPNTALTTMSAHRDFAALDVMATAPVNGWRSRFCLKCHGGVAFDPVPAGGTTYLGGAPTQKPGGYNPTAGLAAYLPATHGAPRTAGGPGSSHFLGNIANIAGDNVTKARTASWWTTAAGIPVYSMYGTGTGTLRNNNTTAPTLASGDQLICESCHSVRWNAFIDNSSAYATSGMYGNLLLYPFIDDGEGQRNGVPPAATTGSVLCVGCHVGGDVAIATLAATTAGSVGLNLYKPAGTHPVTGSTVTKARDVGRAVTTLVTGAGTYADCTAIAPMSYPNVDEMDCDSCHRAHDGAPGSSSPTFDYVLEQADSPSNVQTLCVYCHRY